MAPDSAASKAHRASCGQAWIGPSATSCVCEACEEGVETVEM